VDVDRSSASARVAVVTGANQGLGLALVAGLRSELEADATAYLTGRDAGRVEAAVVSLAERGLAVAGERLDVRDEASVEAFAAMIRQRHGGLDIVFSIAAARISPDKTMADRVPSLSTRTIEAPPASCAGSVRFCVPTAILRRGQLVRHPARATRSAPRSLR